MTNTTLAAQLAVTRQRRALSCRIVAELAGVHPNTVRRVLDGHDARPTTVSAVADALRVELTHSGDARPC